MVNATELPVDTGASAMDMAGAMFGPGITINSATYSGDPASSGIYSNGSTVAPGVTPADTGVILSTGRVTDFTNSSGQANQSASTGTNMAGGINNDAQMNSLVGPNNNTFDAAIFEANFTPSGSILTMQITFSSEEYLEYVGTQFNDVVGVWVNGQKAVLTVGNGDISINNINPGSNPDLYRDNANDQFNTEMDGFTITLTLKAPVNPNVPNTIKIGIADGGDSIYDSNLLIAADSVQTAVIAGDDTFSLDFNGRTTINLLENDLNFGSGSLTITAINGIPVSAGSLITLDSGVVIQVNGDGTITLISGPGDTPGDISFNYEISNGSGPGAVTDVGLVSGELLPCFVSGARIETARGPVPVEDVVVGDMVLTLDEGFQPVRWCGARQVASRGAFGAVHIPAGTFGTHGPLAVSPQHRLFLTGWRAELYCGEGEVLVKAMHLVRSGRLHQDQSGQSVSYHHLLFDRHQIICAEGLWSESYHPGPAALAGHDSETLAELLALFPELSTDPEQGYGPSARPEATAQSAALLVS
jgi:hypothetical protein